MAHILLIEPDRLLAKIYFQALTSVGHSVQVCASAQTAIFCADDQCPDVVILELQLVGHSGIEFLYEFRSYPEWQNVPAIAVTGVPAAEFADSWQLLREELGVKGYHYKPILTLKTLLAEVASAVPARL